MSDEEEVAYTDGIALTRKDFITLANPVEVDGNLRISWHTNSLTVKYSALWYSVPFFQ